jgi:hypothetical protein
MIQLIYVSSATELFSESQLVDLLSQAREHNASIGVTGMLLYKDGNFMQVLEGAADDVQPLYAKIRSDPRHKGVITVLERPVAQRGFAEWSMAFADLDLPPSRAVPGYSEFLNTPLTPDAFDGDPSLAMRMLLLFKANMGGRS